MFAGRHWRAALAGWLIAMATGCGAGGHPDPYHDDLSAQVQSGPIAEYDDDISGVWEGSSVANCIGISIANPGRCGAVENIMLTLIQHGSKVTGSYRCWFGTEGCRNQEESGAIKFGSFKSGRVMVHVMLEDGASCYFTGIPRDNTFNGGYSCVGGTFKEQGRFTTRRRY